MDYLRSDCLLREILEDRKSLPGFLDAIFGFMSRYTDFYHIRRTNDDKIGFPQGYKEQILINCMQKYEHTEKQSFTENLESVPCVAEEIEIFTDEENEQQNSSFINPGVETDKICSTNLTNFNKLDYKNGSVFDNYCWSQTSKDVELHVLLPKVAQLAKHIKVNFQPKFITIKTLFPKEEVLIRGETWDKYRHNDVIWSISDGKLIVIFDKRTECWWDKLFLNETEIDSRTIDSEHSIMYENPDITSDIQNALDRNTGKCSSELSEHQRNTLLRQGWNADNSPFEGKPFDPSMVHF